MCRRFLWRRVKCQFGLENLHEACASHNIVEEIDEDATSVQTIIATTPAKSYYQACRRHRQTAIFIMSTKKSSSSTVLPEITKALLGSCLRSSDNSSDIPLQYLSRASRPLAAQIEGVPIDQNQQGEISYKHHWRECKNLSTAWLTFATAHRAPKDTSDPKVSIEKEEEEEGTRPEEDTNLEPMTSTEHN